MLMAMAVESSFLGKFSSEPGICLRRQRFENPDARHFSFDDPCTRSTRNSVSSARNRRGVCSAAVSSPPVASGERAQLVDAVNKLELAEKVAQETYAQIIRACRELKALNEGRRVHAHITKRGFDKDLYLRYCLVRMYLKCRGEGLADARRLFFQMPQNDVVLWTEMIAAHARAGQGEAAMEIYHQMRVQGLVPNKVTFIMLLKACSSPEMLAHGKLIHSRILEHKLEKDVVLCNVLMKMYVECGSVEDARKVFETMEKRDLVSWTTMAQAESGGEDGERESVRLFRRTLLEGLKPDRIACIVLVNSCAGRKDFSESRWAHNCVLDSGNQGDMNVGTSLINMYGKCGNLQNARLVFDEFRHPSVVFWTTMIAAYAQNKRREALELFHSMLLEGIGPDKMTFATIMNTCSEFNLLKDGRRVHQMIFESGLEPDTIIYNSIVFMYGSCGELAEARRMFDLMLVRRELGTWNAMITSYARHGKWDEALSLFSRMKQLGEKPDGITLAGVLSACAHAGLVEEACRSFGEMRVFFGIDPSLQHYGCIVDVLGRSGWLAEAEEMIRSMPFPGDAAIWTSLCSACKRFGDLERGRRAAVNVARLEPENTGIPELFTTGMYSSGAGDGADEATALPADILVEGREDASPEKEVVGDSAVEEAPLSGAMVEDRDDVTPKEAPPSGAMVEDREDVPPEVVVGGHVEEDSPLAEVIAEEKDDATPEDDCVEEEAPVSGVDATSKEVLGEEKTVTRIMAEEEVNDTPEQVAGESHGVEEGPLSGALVEEKPDATPEEVAAQEGDTPHTGMVEEDEKPELVVDEEASSSTKVEMLDEMTMPETYKQEQPDAEEDHQAEDGVHGEDGSLEAFLEEDPDLVMNGAASGVEADAPEALESDPQTTVPGTRCETLAGSMSYVAEDESMNYFMQVVFEKAWIDVHGSPPDHQMGGGEDSKFSFASNVAKRLIWLAMMVVAISGQGTWSIVSGIQQKSSFV